MVRRVEPKDGQSSRRPTRARLLRRSGEMPRRRGAAAAIAATPTSAGIAAPAPPVLATTAAPAVAATTSARGLLLALRDGERAPVDVGAIERRDSCQALGDLFHVDKRKATRAAVIVGHDVDAHHGAKRRKEVRQLLLRDAEGAVANVGTEGGPDLGRLSSGKAVLHLLRVLHEIHVVGKHRETRDRLEPLMLAVRAAHALAGTLAHGSLVDGIRCFAVGASDHTLLLIGSLREDRGALRSTARRLARRRRQRSDQAQTCQSKTRGSRHEISENTLGGPRPMWGGG